jgi:hypothetical protein
MDYRISQDKNSLPCLKFLHGIKHLPLTKILLDVLNIKTINQIRMFLNIQITNNHLNQLQGQKLKANIKFIIKFICMLATKKNKERKFNNSSSN